MSLKSLLLRYADNASSMDDVFDAWDSQKTRRRSFQTQDFWNSSFSQPRLCRQDWDLKPRRVNKFHHTLANIDKEDFQISMDVKDFAPSEITVKTLYDTLVVEAKHEETKNENGLFSQHFIRKYTLPKEVDVNEVSSSLSADGVLTIRAPLKAKAIETKEKTVPIPIPATVADKMTE